MGSVDATRSAQPSAVRLLLIMVALCLAVVLTGMDQTILATATPVISNEFNALDDLGWWTNVYLLTLSSFQLFYGKLYSLFSIKTIYMGAIGLFEIGSLICTTAPNSVALIIGRAVAGVGAAGIFSGGMLITTKIIPLDRRAAYLGVMSGAFGLAAIIAYPWNDGRLIALFVVFGVLAIAFVVIQMTTITGKARTIPSSLARNRDFWLSASYAMSITGGIYVAVLYLPVWFQTVHGYSAFSSGTMLTPLIAGYVLCSIVAGGLTVVIGYYNPGMIIGTALAIAGAALLTTMNLNTTTARIIGYQLLYGFGVGFGFGQPSYVVQTILPTPDVPIGITFITLVQNLSASVFVAVGQSIFQGELRKRLQAIVPDLDLYSIRESGAADIMNTLPPELQEEGREAYSASLLSTLYISLALSCASAVGALLIRWGSMKKRDDKASASEQTVAPEPQGNKKAEVEGTQA
ncbi:hypothetical protein DL771_003767 [Monosporascus sp. 5C6A]|nr:hypothetical protein DL771_003767 [Monosporascus sp. 5C6A]